MSYIAQSGWLDDLNKWYDKGKAVYQDPRTQEVISQGRSYVTGKVAKVKGQIRSEAAAGATAATKKVMLIGGIAIVLAVLLLRKRG